MFNLKTIEQPTVQVDLNITELALLQAAVHEYHELISSPTSADRDARGGEWADREVDAANAMLYGKLADAVKKAKALSREEAPSIADAAFVTARQASDALEGARKPLLLECSMVNETPEIGVAAKGYFITNPFYDVGMIEKVDSMECWGLSEAQAKLIVALNEELAEAVEDAINAGCLRLQTIAGITDGGYAGVHFSGTEIRNQMMQLFGKYIAADINAAGGLLQPEFATQRHA